MCAIECCINDLVRVAKLVFCVRGEHISDGTEM